MSSKENLATIRERGYHYLVATRQQERDEYLADLESGDGWLTFQKLRQGKYITTVLNEVKIKRVAAESVRSVKEKKLEAVEQRFNRAAKAAVAAQEKGEDEELILQRSLKAVELNREFKNAKAELECEESLILCISQGRTLKDRAIREKQEKKFLADLQALENRSEAKTKSTLAKLHERIGRLKERYPRVARYYAITVDDSTNKVSHTELTEKKELAKQLDGSYIIRTDRNDLTDLEIWQTYMLLTRVESAFRDMKTPLMERPIYHHLENRVQTHIFICILAYHLLALVEKLFRDKAIATSWETIRDELTTHQVVTVVMPYSHSNKVLRIRKATTPEKAHDEIYGLLGITPEPMPPQKSWTTQESQAIFSH
jgi:transposase